MFAVRDQFFWSPRRIRFALRMRSGLFSRMSSQVSLSCPRRQVSCRVRLPLKVQLSHYRHQTLPTLRLRYNLLTHRFRQILLTPRPRQALVHVGLLERYSICPWTTTAPSILLQLDMDLHYHRLRRMSRYSPATEHCQHDHRRAIYRAFEMLSELPNYCCFLCYWSRSQCRCRVAESRHMHVQTAL